MSYIMISASLIMPEEIENVDFEILENFIFTLELRKKNLLSDNEIIYHTNNEDEFMSFLSSHNPKKVNFETQYVEFLKQFENLEILNEEHLIKGENFWIEFQPHEQAKHNRPHIHIKYTDGSKAVITIDEEIKVLKKAHGIKNYEEVLKVVKNNLNELRCAWNKTDAVYKFECIDNIYFPKKKNIR